MDKQKEIEKMAHAIKTSQSTAGYYFPTKAAVRIARGLSEAGYGDVRAAVREFAGVLRDKISREHSLGTKGYIVGFKEMKERALADVDALVKEVCGDE